MIILVSVRYSGFNRLSFSNTNWIENIAKFAAAVDVTARYASHTIQGMFPKFINCKYKSVL